MDSDSVSTSTYGSGQGLKVPMLKPNEFEMWKIRIKQHVQFMDYAIWDLIETPPASTSESLDGTPRVSAPPKTEAEKKQRMIEYKALNILQIALPDAYQHQFKKFTTAHSLWTALEKRFAGTASSKRNKEIC